MKPLYIYHRIPQNMAGDTLYPLNQLKEIYPEIYEQHVAKYEGREWVKDFELPELECIWNDVLHFSPINPELIEDILEEIGFKYQRDTYLKIKLDQLNPDSWMIWHDPIEGQLVRTQDLSYLDDHLGIPHNVVDYYKQCFSDKKHPLLYLGLPHVLFKGELKIVE